MRWKQMDPWYIEQEFTGYRVSKGRVTRKGETEPVMLYTAWAPKAHKYAQAELLDIKTSAQEAIAVCEEHRLSQRL